MSKQAYIEANKQWLADKAREADVRSLADGLLYKVVKAGNPGGRHPEPRSIVTVHYTGRTINGKQFDSSRGGVAPAFRLSELIPAWVIALPRMVPGDVWELYVPAELGYGRCAQPGIPGGSALIFEIELIGVA